MSTPHDTGKLGVKTQMFSVRRERPKKRRFKRSAVARGTDDSGGSCRLVLRRSCMCLVFVSVLSVTLSYRSPLRYYEAQAVYRSSNMESLRGSQTMEVSDPTVLFPDRNSSCKAYVIERDTDYVGHDLNGQNGVKSSGFEHCCAFCSRTMGCRGFTFVAPSSYCWLKHGKGKVVKRGKGEVVSGYLPLKTFRAKQSLLEKSLVQPGTTNSLHTIVTVYQGTPSTSVAEIEGKRVVYGVYQRSHVGLVQDHLLREAQQYVLMKQTIEKFSNHGNTQPLVLDIGANQGLYSLFALKMGAKVIAVEPQTRLCRLINWSVLHNKFIIGKEFILYNTAILDTYDKVHMRDESINEGAIGTIVRGDVRKAHIQAHPINDIVPRNTSNIAYMKIDVEGAELAALKSAYPLFRKRLVNLVVVEFGPPKRWKSTLKMGSLDGLRTLDDMYRFQFEIKLLDSQVYATYGATGTSTVLNGHADFKKLIDAMGACNCEAYVSFQRDLSKPIQEDTSYYPRGFLGRLFDWLWGFFRWN
jgi:FkbM family methyltransferase